MRLQMDKLPDSYIRYQRHQKLTETQPCQICFYEMIFRDLKGGGEKLNVISLAYFKDILPLFMDEILAKT